MRSSVAAVFALALCFVSCNGRPEECELGPQPPRPPVCFNEDPTWTYDYVTNVCQKIEKYGCPGYDNVFATEDECIQTCVQAEKSLVLADIERRNALYKEPKIVNGIMDKVFSAVGWLIKKLGKDPLEAPELTTDAIPLLQIRFEKGSLSGFSNLARYGDWKFGAESKSKWTIHGGIGISDITMNYTMIARMFGSEGDADVSAFIETFAIQFDFLIDVLGCTIEMKSFKIGEIADIKLNIAAIPFLDPVIGPVTQWLTNALLDMFKSKAETTVVETVGVIDVCKMIKDYVG